MSTGARLVSLPGKMDMLLIRQEYLAITNGDACAAALLNWFERLTLWLKETGKAGWIRIYQAAGADIEGRCEKGKAEWIRISNQTALGAALLGAFKGSQVKTAMNLLRRLGFITAADGGVNRYDKRLKYTLVVEKVQDAINAALNGGESSPIETPSGTDGTDTGDSSNGQNTPLDKSPVTHRVVAGDLSPLKDQVLDQESLNQVLDQGPESAATNRADEDDSHHPPAAGAEVVDEPLNLNDGKLLPFEEKENDKGEEPTALPPISAPPPSAADPIAAERKVWGTVMNQLELQLERTTFETWIKGAWLRRVERDAAATTYIIGVSNNYARDMCQLRLYRTLRRAASEASGIGSIALKFEVAVDIDPPSSETEPPLFRLLAAQVPETTRETAGQLYARCLGEVDEERKQRIDRLAALYPADKLARAIIMTAARSTTVREPLNYICGVLAKSS